MSRLKALKPVLGQLPSRLAVADDLTRDQLRNRNQAWRNWYKTARWMKLRFRIFTRDLFTCQWPGCGALIGDTSQLVAHHSEPHRGDPAIFWNERKIITVCKKCHDGPIQAQEAQQYPR